MISPERVELYRRLAEVAVVEAADGTAVLASVQPGRPEAGALAPMDGDATVEGIRAGEDWLRARGCRRVVGPMEVSTWFPYRARLGPEDAPTFFGEPVAGPEAWRRAGYGEVARYRSERLACETAIAAARRAPPPGIAVRTLGPDAGGALDRIHALSHACFSSAYLFTALPRWAFEALYRPLIPRLDPAMVLFAERGGETLGFMLAMPDLGGPAGRFVIKTVAVREDARRLGITTLLMGQVYRAAVARGCTHGISALMWTDSASTRVCPAEVLREYALYGRVL